MLDVFEIELFSVAPPGFKLGVKRKTLREQHHPQNNISICSGKV